MRTLIALFFTLGLCSIAFAQTGTALVRHAPLLNGTIQGSVQQMLAENGVLNGGAVVTGDLLVPGLPVIQRNGHPAFAGTIDGSGAATPTGYQITLNGGASLRHVIRRTNPVVLPAVSAPPSPSGTRTVQINSPNGLAGDFATLRHLTLNGSAGQVAVPPGTYGDFTANGGNGFTLGIAGALVPSVYNFQRLTLNGATRLQVVGPIVVTVAHGFTANGQSGSSAHPSWLSLKVYSGNFTLNGGSSLYGYLTAPSSTVVINGNSQLIGGVISDRLTVNGSGLLKLAPLSTSNQPPTAHAQAVTSPEDVAKALLLTATDPDGGTLTYTVVTAPAHGTLSGTTPHLTYTPAVNFHGSDSFTFKANDGQADSPPALVAITITPVNDAPSATSRMAVTDEDTAVAITLVGTDPEAVSLTLAVTTPPAHGTLSGTSPHLNYTPALNYHGPESFTFSASDGSLNSAPGVVAISVNSVNDVPLATPRSLSVPSGSSTAVTLAGSDADGDPLTFHLVTPPTHGALSGIVPDLVYTPNPSFIGSDSFTFRAFDGTASSAPVAVVIGVSARPNRAPVANAQAITVPEDAPRELTLIGSDPEGDTLLFSILVPPAHGSVQPRAGFPGAYTYTPSKDYSGPDHFSFKVSDGTLDSAAAAVSIQVSAINDAPVANVQTLATDEDTALELTLTGSDVESSPLTFIITTPPLHGTLEPRAGNSAGFIYTPTSDYAGLDRFSFKAHDGSLDSLPVAIVLTVRAVNDAPMMVATEPVTTPEDVPLKLVLSATDAEADAVTFSIETPPAHGTLEPKAGTSSAFTYSPALHFHGADSFTVKASDPLLASLPALIAIDVSPVNDAPIATSRTLTLPQDTTNSLTLSATDVENDVLTYTIVALPGHGTLSGTGANRIYTSEPGYQGSDTFTFRVNDGQLDSDLSVVTLNVVDINHAPVASSQSILVVEDTSKPIVLGASDADGDPISFTIVIPPAHGTLVSEAGFPRNVVYTPAADYAGSDHFVFSAGDGSLDSAPATVSLNIVAVNDAPVAIPQALATNEDVALAVALAATDAESSALTYVIVTPPAHGLLTAQPGAPQTFLYTPALDYSGSDNFEFKVGDGTVESATATVAITVRSLNDPPVPQAPGLIAAMEDIGIDILLGGTDPDSIELTRLIVALPTHGTLIAKAGSPAIYTYTPALNYSGPDSFGFKLNDGHVESDSLTVVISVAGVNDQPTANAATVSLMSGVPTPLTLSGSDIETSQSSLVYRIVSGPAHGALSGTPPHLTYTTSADFSGSDQFTFTVTDGSTTSAPATVQLSSGLPPRARTYTTTADFKQGVLDAVSTDVADQLSNKNVLSAYDVVWVANSSKGTVAKIDSETGRVVGEYLTAPASVASPYPSRIAVDSRGNAWVANYSHGSIVKIGQPANGYGIDRNGSDTIDSSDSLGDVKPWTGADSVSTASDEAILLYVRTSAVGVRHISVDANDHVWVAGYSGPWQQFDGRTGALLREEAALGSGGQGGFIAADGTLYSSGADFMIWPTQGAITSLPRAANVLKNAWSSALDSKGNLWVTRDGSSNVSKYSPAGENLGEFYHGEPWAMGIAIDANDHVWIAHSHCGHSVGHLLPDGGFVGNVEVANHGPVEVSIDRRGRIWVVSSTGVVERINPLGGPLGSDGVTPVGEVDVKTGNLGGTLWTYGRFTGTSFGLAAPEGNWTNIHDGVLAGSTWGPAVWNGIISNDAQIQIEASLSADGVAYGPVQTLTLDHPVPEGSGRYLKTRVRLISATTGETPALHDLTVGTTGYSPPVTAASWSISAGEDLAGNWPDVIQLKGAFRRSIHSFLAPPSYTWSVVDAPAGGTVTFDSATVLRPKVQFGARGTYVMRLTANLAGVVTTDETTVVLTPYNRAPYVNAGYTTFVSTFPPQLWLWGEVRDDGLPIGAAVSPTWQKLFGPGTVSFTDPGAAATRAVFSTPGVYTMVLRATDGELLSENTTDVWIGVPPPPAPPAGLVSWWAASGNGDDHVSGNQAFTERGATYADGKIAGAFRFDGVNDRVRVFSAPSLDVGRQQGITVELWTNPSSERTATLFHYGAGSARGVQLRQVNRTIEVNFRDAAGADHLLGTSQVLTLDVWTHLTASYNRTTGEARIFANGVLQSAKNFGPLTLGTNYDIFMGSAADGSEAYAGLLDEISIYDRAIFADEVTSIVARGKRPPVSNLPPVVTAGADLFAQPVGAPVALTGSVRDDAQPVNGALSSTWTKVAGPGTVTFENPNLAATQATFSAAGLYVLKLTAEDGAFDGSDTLEVRVASYGEIKPDNSLAAWWPANGNDSDVVHRHKVERFHGMDFTSGQIEQGFALDGIDDHGRIEAHPDLDVGASAAGMSVELWVKPASRQHATLLQWGSTTADGVRLWQDEDYGVGLHCYFTDITGAEHPITALGVFETTDWVHVAATYDKLTGIARIYRNGTIVAERNLGIFTPQTRYPMQFGSSVRTGRHFNGTLDEISLFTRPLTPSEVRSLYFAGALGKNPVDNNQLPSVSAGRDLVVQGGAEVANLLGTVTDDGLPTGSSLQVEWSKVDGPGLVNFGKVDSARTTATFTAAGIYLLRLTANDGINQSSDLVEIRVGLTGQIETDSSLAAWWPANGDFREVVRGGHDVERVNGLSYGAGQVSQGFVFGEAGAHGRIEAHADLDVGASASGMSVELWVKPTPNQYVTLLQWGDNDGGRREAVARC